MARRDAPEPRSCSIRRLLMLLASLTVTGSWSGLLTTGLTAQVQCDPAVNPHRRSSATPVSLVCFDTELLVCEGLGGVWSGGTVGGVAAGDEADQEADRECHEQWLDR
jgi:hypothetical protein